MEPNKSSSSDPFESYEILEGPFMDVNIPAALPESKGLELSNLNQRVCVLQDKIRRVTNGEKWNQEVQSEKTITSLQSRITSLKDAEKSRVLTALKGALKIVGGVTAMVAYSPFFLLGMIFSMQGQTSIDVMEDNYHEYLRLPTTHGPLIPMLFLASFIANGANNISDSFTSHENRQLNFEAQVLSINHELDSVNKRLADTKALLSSGILESYQSAYKELQNVKSEVMGSLDSADRHIIFSKFYHISAREYQVDLIEEKKYITECLNSAKEWADELRLRSEIKIPDIE